MRPPGGRVGRGPGFPRAQQFKPRSQSATAHSPFRITGVALPSASSPSTSSSPETVARRVAGTVQSLGLDRFDMKYTHGSLPHEAAMEGIRLYGEKVVPMVREMLGE